MGERNTTPEMNAATATEAGSVSNRLRHWITAYRNSLPSKRRVRGRVIMAAFGMTVVANSFGVAVAQQQGGGGGGAIGNEVCGTAITETINGVAPIVLFVVVVGGLMLGYLLHAWSGFKKDPQQAKVIKEWRNRAIISAVSAPLLGKGLEILLGIMGLGLANCIDIVPGI